MHIVQIGKMAATTVALVKELPHWKGPQLMLQGFSIAVKTISRR